MIDPNDSMTSSKPYLIRAIHEWILDNQMTPHLVVDAGFPNAQVPMEFAEDGKIVLNISPGAVKGLIIGNEWVQFNARFSGAAREVMVPSEAVLGIFTRENGQGMVFPEPRYPESSDTEAQTASGPRLMSIGDTGGEPGDSAKTGRARGKGKGGPTLKVVK